MTTLLAAEFLYTPRPKVGNGQRVFDYAFLARLRALEDGDTLLLLCSSEATRQSVAPLLRAFPRLRLVSEIVNPQPRPTQTDTPYACDWQTPALWQQMTMSDRWARIDAALRVASTMSDGVLLMPALDAVYDHRLLERMIAQHCAVGVATPHAQIFPPNLIPNTQYPIPLLLLNAAFDRATLASACQDGGQGFWGKLGMIPFELCAAVLANADHQTWEDDLEIDRVLAELGSPAACLWIDDPSLYHLAPPIFAEADARRAIERHLHYSLKIPGERRSALHSLPSMASLARAAADPAYAAALAGADALIADCEAEMRGRVARYGASWVDWGGYRYVARVGDPAVEVWKLTAPLL